ncbi:hypothetical protein BH10BAC4_BH10BAC4_24450 [soil metagenome]
MGKIASVIVAILFLQFDTRAQSKLTLINKSELTGIGLPEGSKQDKRIFPVAAAQTLMEMEANDYGIKVSENIEVFSLPPSATNEFKNQVLQRAKELGWQVTQPRPQSKFYQIQKNSQQLLLYLESGKKETSFYVAPINAPIETTATQVAQTTQTTQVKETIISTPVKVTTVITAPAVTNPEPVKKATTSGNFKFNTTNFDDGWISTEQENWVEVTKGNVKALIHYPNKITSEYYSDGDEAKRIAWNTLVAPRYTNLQNYFIGRNTLSYIQASFISGTLTENQTGRTVYVALFKRDNSAWIEFVAQDINSFGEVTGFDVSKLNGAVQDEAWSPLQKIDGYNKFAVAASDLTGKWSNQFSGMQQYVNAYTGADAGATSYASAQSFEFLVDGSYHWQISTAGGVVGNLKFNGAKSNGKFSMANNWQINFSDLEGKPRLYNAFFSCVKGARVLWLQDTGYGDYTKYGRE